MRTRHTFRPTSATGFTLPPPKAFTLVELLVVIGIIAVLIGILLPSLNAARRQAETIKCASALRQLGAGYQLYAAEYRGYLPAAKTEGTYVSNSVVSPVTNPFWFDFLAPILARTKKTNTSSTTAAEAADSQNTVMWGCPAFERYRTGALGDYNRQQPGYGMNYAPTYSPENPALGTHLPRDFYKPNTNPPQRDKAFWVTSIDNWKTSTPATGTWFKLINYTRPSERALMADTQFWLLEAYAPPLTGKIPPQKIYDVNTTWSTGVSGQTLYDFYRHGKLPPIQVGGSTGYYRSDGGRVSYNILYVDGHVATTNSREEGYRAVRMRFPG